MAIDIVTFSSSGGAGNVARTFRDGFNAIGIEARIHNSISTNLSTEPFAYPLVTASASVDHYLLRKRSWPSLISYSRDNHSSIKVDLSDSELVIFRWMNGILGDRFMEQSNDIGKVVWGLADMNPFTGVCHYSGSCDGFVNGCSSCPALRSAFSGLAQMNVSRKERILEKLTPEFVAPTDWMFEQAKKSHLLKKRPVHKILNPLSNKFFEATGNRPTTEPTALSVTIIAASLDDPTKGVWTIVSELQKLIESKKIKLSLAGLASTKLRRALDGADFYGQISNQEILNVLAETNVLLVPSLFENAGTVVAEAASQGVPSIARRVGGMPEMTNYGHTGYLFDEPKDLLSIFDSLTKKDLKKVGRLAKDWSQNLRPEIICAEYANQFLKSNR